MGLTVRYLVVLKSVQIVKSLLNKLRRFMQMRSRKEWVEIQPRQLLFSILARHGGRIDRATLIDEIERLGHALQDKGYLVNIVFKGGPGEWWNEGLDSEIQIWKGSLIEEPEPDVYVFAPKRGWDEEPYKSLEGLVRCINADLDVTARKILTQS